VTDQGQDVNLLLPVCVPMGHVTQE